MKKFVNFKFVVMFALALVANVASYAQDNVIDEVVWVIGDEAILKSDVEEAQPGAYKVSVRPTLRESHNKDHHQTYALHTKRPVVLLPHRTSG